MIEIKYKESYNKHLKLIDENDNEILEKIIKYLIKTLKKEILSVLNIGGGFVKANEKFLSNHPNINYYVLDIQNSEN